VLVLTTLPYIIPALAKVQALRILRVVRGVHIMRQMKVRLTLIRSQALGSPLIPDPSDVSDARLKGRPHRLRMLVRGT
jgi:hypothetical protein